MHAVFTYIRVLAVWCYSNLHPNDHYYHGNKFWEKLTNSIVQKVTSRCFKHFFLARAIHWFIQIYPQRHRAIGTNFGLTLTKTWLP